MESLETLSQDRIALRLSQVKAVSPQAAEARKPGNQHILRLSDIAAYIGVPRGTFYKPSAVAKYQKELSWFFRLWDSGALVKEKVNGVWGVRRNQGVAQVASSAGTQGSRIDMRIEMTAAGPRLKGL